MKQGEDNRELRRDYFITLREEIRETKARIFRIVIISVIGVITFAFLAPNADRLALLLAPFGILIMMMLYLAEQNELMRAGRYIMENVEQSDRDWEHWVAARQLRSAERQFFACFIIVFFVFYVTTIWMALPSMLEDKGDYPFWQEVYWRYGAPIAYGVGTLWAIATVARFWRTAVSTSD